MKVNRLKSSALYYTLFLSVVFGIALGGLILMSESNRKLLMITDIETQLMNNARSGVAFGQVYFKDLIENTPNYYRLFDSGIDSIYLEKSNWGVFSILESTAIHGKKNFSMLAMVGIELDSNLPTLYLSDNGRPLTICGDTKLKGECHLPKSGLKRGYIEGQNYKGSKLVYGTTKVSTRELPEIYTFSDLNIDGEKRLIGNENLNERRSFKDETLVLISDQGLILNSDTLDGRIIVISKDSIIVGSNCKLDQVILSSPIIKIESDFKGAVQIFAENEIIIADKVILTYPSAIVLEEKSFPIHKNASIQIGQNSHLIGTVVLNSNQPNFRMPVELNLAKNSKISGLVYCQGKTQLLGEIEGHLFTEKFFLKTKSSSYENHLLNGIVSNKLPANFTAANIFNSTSQLKLITWLN